MLKSLKKKKKGKIMVTVYLGVFGTSQNVPCKLSISDGYFVVLSSSELKDSLALS